MTKLELNGSRNYAAQIVRIPKLVQLPGLDNLVGVPVLGGQALVAKDEWKVGDLAIAFGPETQLSQDFTSKNNLYRHQELNSNPGRAGYLEDNRRVRAITLRKHPSNVLLLPLESIFRLVGVHNPPAEGDAFDHIDGVQICQKYVVPVKAGNPGATKLEKAFKRVDQDKVFPKHLETDQFARNVHTVPFGKHIIVTQKLHGTSIRVGNVPVLRTKGRVEKFLNRWFPTATHEFAMVYGSKNSVKDANNTAQAHFYDDDIWTIYGKQLDGIIPEGYIVYGELVGFTPGGGAIQPKYTYNAAPSEAELYIYRVAYVNDQGVLADLPWDGVREFCDQRGLNHVPELHRLVRWEEETTDSAYADGNLQDYVEYTYLNTRYFDQWEKYSKYQALLEVYGDRLWEYVDKQWEENKVDVWTPADEDEPFVDRPLPLSDPKSVDEGVCLRWDGIVPTTLKAKASKFLEHETKQLDAEVVTLEDEA